MIPISVRMTGWMRYRDETLADLSGGPLIAICGENGAGKSSIFDAITFALYGQHRLGKMQAAQLISEDRDRLSVEFEFEAEGQRYLVRRSRGKKQGERDQSLWIADGRGEWAPIPGTEKEDALDLAIAKVVRLSHAAFTSSFMLHQGDSTAFIDADPKPRFEIISSLIGLKEYEKLEKAAREATKKEKDRIDWVGEKLAEIGDLDAAGVERLRVDCEALARQEADATDLLLRARTLLADAQRYTRLASEVASLHERIAAAATLIEQREQIENDARLFDTLSSALDGIKRIKAAISDASRSEAAAADARRRAIEIDLEALAATEAAATAEVDRVTTERKAAEKALVTATQREREAHDFAQLAAAVLEGRLRVATFDKRVREIDAELRARSAAGTKLEQGEAAARKSSEAAEKAAEAARKSGATERARADALKEELAQRKESAKEAKCKRCGQPIDKAAAKQQIAELAAQTEEAQRTATAATAAEQSAIKARAAAAKAAEQAQAALTKHAREMSGLTAARAEATSAGTLAATAVANEEAKLNGRLKDAPAAADLHKKASAELAWARARADQSQVALEQATMAFETARQASLTAKDRRAELDSTAREQEATAAGHRALAASTADGLGELGARALEDPDEVLRALIANQRTLADAPTKKAALEKAQEQHTTASAQHGAKQEEIDTIPGAHQIDEAIARESEKQAEADASRVRAQHQAAQQLLATADAQVSQIAGLHDDKARAELRHKHLKKLTSLLGKKGLQGMLVQGALTTITNHANAFLGRLTGGMLQLTLERDGDALELKAIDHSCMREARSAKALSGSQKFRCAVAIASGIGQYAGAGGMRSIVIDEGFGSLDTQSQKGMVEELKQLAQHMDKVIVVSHLEAFTDPVNFPDRLEVRTAGDGASTIVAAT